MNTLFTKKILLLVLLLASISALLVAKGNRDEDGEYCDEDCMHGEDYREGERGEHGNRGRGKDYREGNRSEYGKWERKDVDETYGYGEDGEKGHALNISHLPKEELSEDVKEGLMYMLEEEKLARDVYKKLYESYTLNVFSNIPQSEQRHIDGVRTLVSRYGIEYDTENDEKIGEFNNQELQDLYNDLITKGEKSLIDALEVGATIEDLDIYDIEEFLEKVDNQDITVVYNNLINGSKNHLRAFNRQLVKNGKKSYKAQYLSQAQIDEILAGAKR